MPIKFVTKNIKHIAKRLFINPVNNRTKTRIMTKFADKYGLNYVGFVNQHTEQEKVVRGFSVSASHEDNHYCIGNITGRNVEVVDREDAVWMADGTVAKHSWIVMSFKLSTTSDIPHFFINAKNHDTNAYHALFASHPLIKELELGTLEEYSTDFTSRFAIYAQPSSSIEIQKLLPNRITRVIGAHFWPLSTECHNGVIYIYADNKQATQNLLDTMVKCGIWLADHLDKQVEQI